MAHTSQVQVPKAHPATGKLDTLGARSQACKGESKAHSDITVSVISTCTATYRVHGKVEGT